MKKKGFRIRKNQFLTVKNDWLHWPSFRAKSARQFPIPKINFLKKKLTLIPIVILVFARHCFGSTRTSNVSVVCLYLSFKKGKEINDEWKNMPFTISRHAQRAPKSSAHQSHDVARSSSRRVITVYNMPRAVYSLVLPFATTWKPMNK